MPRSNNMNSIHNRGFQMSLPVYVKNKPIQAGGRIYKQGEVFPWREKGMSPERVANMFPRLLRHRAEDLQSIGVEPPRKGPDRVKPEPSAKDLLAMKSIESMTMRELKIVAESVSPDLDIGKTKTEAVENLKSRLGEGAK